MQLSPCHAGLAGLRDLRLHNASRFSAMLLSLLPFGAGKAADLKDLLQILSRYSGIQYELLRRTARHERTLEAVSCSALFGAGAGRDIGFLSLLPGTPTPSSLPFHQLRKGPQLPRHVGAHHPKHHLGCPLCFHGGKALA